MIGHKIHGERIVDGDASTPNAITLYISGSTVARTLGSTEFLVITDLTIHTEAGGDLSLAADDDSVAGETIQRGVFAAKGGIDKTYRAPFRCPKGVVPKFKGASSDVSICIVEGYIEEA